MIKKLCKDCKHYSFSNMTISREAAHLCNILKNQPHPVTGEPIREGTECTAMRLGPCTLEGKWWEPIVFQVYLTQGQGALKGPIFKTLQEALTHVEQHKGEASFGIKLPDGNWHQWLPT